MKFGLCAKLDSAALAAELGFDYIEPPINGIAALSEEEFAVQVEKVTAVGIETPTFNLLFPSTLELYTATDEEIAAYLHTAMRRVQTLGGKIAVFGSGKSRTRPDHMSYGDAFRRLSDVTHTSSAIAAQYGITIAIEPLNRSETNMINSMAEGAALAASANSDNVHLLSDYYHVAKEGEPFYDIVRLGGVIHSHIASVFDRRFPLDASREDFTGFFFALKESGYDARISIEGVTEDLRKDGPAALDLLKKL